MNNKKNEGYYNNFIVNNFYRSQNLPYCGRNSSDVICPICKLILFKRKSLSSAFMQRRIYERLL